MALQQGERYRCPNCEAEIAVIKSSGTRDATYGSMEYGSGDNSKCTALLKCCDMEMQKEAPLVFENTISEDMKPKKRRIVF
jgi:hypothetical protein